MKPILHHLITAIIASTITALVFMATTKRNEAEYRKQLTKVAKQYYEQGHKAGYYVGLYSTLSHKNGIAADEYYQAELDRSLIMFDEQN